MAYEGTGGTGTVLIGSTSGASYSATLPTAVQGNITSTGTLGNQLNTTRVCFLAYLSSSASNVTGDGTAYQIAFDTVPFDQGSNFTTGASAHFTAPVTGKYFFTCNVAFTPANSSSGFSFAVDLVATSRTLRNFYSLAAGTALNNPDTFTTTGIIDMSANDTMHVTATASAGAKTTSIDGTGSPYVTFVSGYLLC